MKTFSPNTAIAVIIANMVGTGVFTALGFQLLDLPSVFPILLLWFLGGIAALCGALCYAELGAALPRSGGEYNFLARTIHPAAGFVSGWVSATIGFAAPVAAAAITFGKYFSASVMNDPPEWAVKLLAVALVAAATIVHGRSRSGSAGMQLGFTLIKIAVIIVFCFVALMVVDLPQTISVLPQTGDSALITSGAFAVSLIYVSYGYTGWNAATYLSGELPNPQKDLPRVLLIGTGTVMVLYLALNYTFLKVAPIEAMVGQVEVGYIAAKYAFGETGAQATGLVLSLLLISTVSAMTLAGPRVLQVIGEDYPVFAKLGVTNKDGIPSLAIALQSVIACVFILTSSFQWIVVFAGFTLGLNSFITVISLFILRWRMPEIVRPFKVPLFPVPALIYLGLTGWTLFFVFKEKPDAGLVGLGVIAAGAVFYVLTKMIAKKVNLNS